MPKDEPQGCLLAIFTVLRRLFGKKVPALPYRRKDYLLTKAERAFFGVLQRAASDQYLIFAMVRLADLLYLPRGIESYQAHFNRIRSKHIDFVLCDPETIRPLLAIELDDSSHKQRKRQVSDAFINGALDAAGLPLLRVPARARYDTEELAESIKETIQT